jgi:hypothetical protein
MPRCSRACRRQRVSRDRPARIRTRIAERPTGEQVSVTMADKLAGLGAFVHRTAIEDEHTYAVRIEDDELRDAAAKDEERRAGARARHGEATRSNLGLGQDVRAV